MRKVVLAAFGVLVLFAISGSLIYKNVDLSRKYKEALIQNEDYVKRYYAARRQLERCTDAAKFNLWFNHAMHVMMHGFYQLGGAMIALHFNYGPRLRDVAFSFWAGSDPQFTEALSLYDKVPLLPLYDLDSNSKFKDLVTRFLAFRDFFVRVNSDFLLVVRGRIVGVPRDTLPDFVLTGLELSTNLISACLTEREGEQ